MVNRNEVSEGYGVPFQQRIDVRENDQGYVIAIDVPALSRDGCKVALKDNVLIIEGEKWDERRYEAFRRDFRLSDDGNPERIRSEYKNGIWSIHIQKK